MVMEIFNKFVDSSPKSENILWNWMVKGKCSPFSLQLKYKQLLLLEGTLSQLPEESNAEHIFGFSLS